jgi:hypothetical protein
MWTSNLSCFCDAPGSAGGGGGGGEGSEQRDGDPPMVELIKVFDGVEDPASLDRDDAPSACYEVGKAACLASVTSPDLGLSTTTDSH